MSHALDPRSDAGPPSIGDQSPPILGQQSAGARVIRLAAGNGTDPQPGALGLSVGWPRHPLAFALPPPSLRGMGGRQHDRIDALMASALTEPQPTLASEPGEAALLRLLMQGQDIAAAALALIRLRFPGQDVCFLAPDQTPADPEPGNEARVDEGGQRFGRLRSRTISVARLLPQAAWLAAWLALRDQYSQLYHAAVTDPITGAHNRRFFDYFLEFAIGSARARHQPMTLLVFDIDDFKQFNERHGHGAGDEILRHTVRLLRSVIRPSDRVCRIGGDEFAVVFHDPAGPRTTGSRPLSSVFQLAGRFQQAICEHKFPELGCDAPGRLTVSGGLATYPLDGHDAASLLAGADAFARASKKAGKNCMSMGPATGRGATDAMPANGR
jgi:diguanylate cyclase (GGDEF)-like protein